MDQPEESKPQQREVGLNVSTWSPHLPETRTSKREDASERSPTTPRAFSDHDCLQHAQVTVELAANDSEISGGEPSCYQSEGIVWEPSCPSVTHTGQVQRLQLRQHGDGVHNQTESLGLPP